MKKFKRVAALACVGTMVMSQVVPTFAGEISLSGNVGVENDNSETPSGEFKVELPTETEGLYDFTLDPDGLLYQYDNAAYNNTDSAYFAGMSAPVVESKDAAKTKLGIMEWTEISSPTLTTLFSVTAGTDEESDVDTAVDATVDATNGSTYAVWTPDPDGIAEAKGTWVGITKDNYKNYITTTYKAADNTLDTMTLRANGQSGEFIYDGKIYKKVFKEVTDGNELAEYLTVTTDSDGAVSVVLNTEKGTLYKSAGTARDEEALTDADTDITYTAPVAQNTGVSQTAKIVNNGLAPVIVTAQVNVNTDCGLEFAENDTFTSGKKGDVYLALTQVDKTTPANSVSYPVKTTKDAESGEVVSNEVSQTFVLDGISAAGTTKYQDTNGDKDAATGSHNYRQYLNPNVKPSSQDFTLTVKANTDAGWKTKWVDYVQKLRNEEAVKPVVSVVYSFNEEILITSANRTNTAAQVFSGEGVTYTSNAKGQVTAIRQVVDAEAVGYYEEGSNCGFTIDGADMKGTITAKISTTGANGTFAALTIKKPTTSDGAATFAATAIKAEENVWVEVAVPAASSTAPAMTYVFQIR